MAGDLTRITIHKAEPVGPYHGWRGLMPVTQWAYVKRQMSMHKGKLIGVGTGPGDPELVSRKAWSRISHAKVIAYPAADSGTSFARSIVSEAISDDVLEIEMKVPMRTGRKPAQDIYDEGASAISAQLDKGHDVVVLCERRPSILWLFHVYIGASS